MRILSISGFAPYWQRYPANVLDLENGPTVGGGEEAFLRTAAGLAALGHRVEAFHCGDGGVWRDVKFHGPEAPLFPRLHEPWDVILGWSTIKHAGFARDVALRAGRKPPLYLLCQQLNDLWCEGDWSAVGGVVSPSHDHAKQVPKWGWLGPRAVVHNGLDPELYEDAPPWDSRPPWVGYWSSPDRGLHHLLRAWPFVREAIPEARLHVFYEIKRFLKMAEHYGVMHYGARGAEIGQLVARATADDTIVMHGAVPRKQLAKVQKQCRVMCYPYDPFAYCEGFAGAVNQGLAAGCSVLARPLDALPSLYAGAIHWLEKDPIDLGFSRWLAELVIAALRDEIPDLGSRRARGMYVGRRVFNWRNAALEMERACRGQWWRKDHRS